MIKTQLVPRGINQDEVLSAFRQIDRAAFVPPEQEGQSYIDYPLDIGFGQTISQPFIVAYMTQLLDIHHDHKVLEIGTGSGFQTGILSCLCREVFTIERIPELQKAAAMRLGRLERNNIHYLCTDGHWGWKEMAPFNRIIVTAAAADFKALKELVTQLASGGKLLAPVGSSLQQNLFLFYKEIPETKNYTGTSSGNLLEGVKVYKDLPVRFVPFVSSGS